MVGSAAFRAEREGLEGDSCGSGGMIAGMSGKGGEEKGPGGGGAKSKLM